MNQVFVAMSSSSLVLRDARRNFSRLWSGRVAITGSKFASMPEGEYCLGIVFRSINLVFPT